MEERPENLSLEEWLAAELETLGLDDAGVYAEYLATCDPDNEDFGHGGTFEFLTEVDPSLDEEKLSCFTSKFEASLRAHKKASPRPSSPSLSSREGVDPLSDPRPVQFGTGVLPPQPRPRRPAAANPAICEGVGGAERRTLDGRLEVRWRSSV